VKHVFFLFHAFDADISVGKTAYPISNQTRFLLARLMLLGGTNRRSPCQKWHWQSAGFGPQESGC